ncbi:MAG: ABC transporter ATP-binding protein [Thaumarchaeota archaeon 13_1_40CM_4_38_7]|nr:MAG: ABC transporter ATP-binding protein [Thaumarchaeota archaeon 13_1_40CM_4_38_7]
MIKIQNLTKRYQKLTAVDNLNLEIAKNEVFGLLGPNGAGKTTVIHMLATLLKPTSGTAIVNGYDIISDPSKVRSSIGIVFQAPSSDDMLTGYENLRVHTSLYQVPSSQRKKRIQAVLELVGLADRQHDQVKKYSGGMRRRLEIARGLLHKPKVMFLDEPTLGLDPSSREMMWKYIEKLVKEEEMTLILTTHYMEEADHLCNRIGIIDQGKIIALDTPANLKRSIGGDIVKIKTKSHTDLEELRKLVYVRKIESVDGNVILYVDNARANIADILQHVKAEYVEFRSPDLNDVFLKLASKNIKEDGEGGFMERYAQYGK